MASEQMRSSKQFFLHMGGLLVEWLGMIGRFCYGWVRSRRRARAGGMKAKQEKGISSSSKMNVRYASCHYFPRRLFGCSGSTALLHDIEFAPEKQVKSPQPATVLWQMQIAPPCDWPD